MIAVSLPFENPFVTATRILVYRAERLLTAVDPDVRETDTASFIHHHISMVGKTQNDLSSSDQHVVFTDCLNIIDMIKSNRRSTALTAIAEELMPLIIAKLDDAQRNVIQICLEKETVSRQQLQFREAAQVPNLSDIVRFKNKSVLDRLNLPHTMPQPLR